MVSFSSAVQILRCTVPLKACPKLSYYLYLVKVSCLSGGQYTLLLLFFSTTKIIKESVRVVRGLYIGVGSQI